MVVANMCLMLLRMLLVNLCEERRITREELKAKADHSQTTTGCVLCCYRVWI